MTMQVLVTVCLIQIFTLTRWLFFFADLLMPHLDLRAARKQSRAFQVPRQRRDVRACLQGASLHPTESEQNKCKPKTLNERVE